MADNPVPIQFPLGGIAENGPYTQSPGRTVVRPDQVLNVRAHDAFARRARGGKRTGISKFISERANQSIVRALGQVVEAVPVEQVADIGAEYSSPSAVGGNIDQQGCIAMFSNGKIAHTYDDYGVSIGPWDATSGFGSFTTDSFGGGSADPSGDVMLSHDEFWLFLYDPDPDAGRVVLLNSSQGVVDNQNFGIDGENPEFPFSRHPEKDLYCWCGVEILKFDDGELDTFRAGGGTPSFSEISDRLYKLYEHQDFDNTSSPGTSAEYKLLFHPSWTDRCIVFDFSATSATVALRQFDPDGATIDDMVGAVVGSSLALAVDADSDDISEVLQASWHPDGEWLAIAWLYNTTSVQTEYEFIQFDRDNGAQQTWTHVSPDMSTGSPANEVDCSVAFSADGAFIFIVESDGANTSDTHYLRARPFNGVSVGDVADQVEVHGDTTNYVRSALRYHPTADAIFLLDAVDDSLRAWRFTPPAIQSAGRLTRLYSVQGGSFYRSDPAPPSEMVQPDGGSGILSTSVRPGHTVLLQQVFLCDGQNDSYSYYSVADDQVNAWADDITDGSLPTGTSSDGCRIIATYRNRIVMAGLETEPQNWFMSAVGDPFDFDYSPTTPSATQAVAGDVSEAGQVGDVITALIPYQDDLLFIGGVNSLWVIRGDPAAGGAIDNISRELNIVGPHAWTQDESGVIYFLSRNGLYRFQGSNPQPVSRQKLDKTFNEIDFDTNNVDLVYDSNWLGVHIFISPLSEPDSAGDHYFWDQRTDSFWRDQYPTSIGPSAVFNFRGETEGGRGVLMGGYDGYIRVFDPDATDDDGTAIESHCRFPLLHPGLPMGQFQMKELQVTLAAADMAKSAYFDILRGDTPEEAADASTAVASKLLQPGRNVPLRKNVRANSLAFRIRDNDSDEPWAFEAGSVIVGGVGRIRKQVSA